MKHILIVDDSKINLRSARTTLCDIYKITAVTSGEQAFGFLENNTCDLILLDINMPEMDGFEVLRRIRMREETGQIPVIFLTAESDPETENRCLEEGAMDFIAKPFVPAVMLSRIGRILELEDMRKQLEDKLEKKIREVSDMKSKSSQDALTGLWNRAYTEEAVNAVVSGGGKGALFMIDMDNFKAINDNYGHIEGDNTLKKFAETMRKFSSGDDVLCRIGGDEFVMFLNGATSKVEIGRLAEKIISDLCDWLEKKKFETNSSVSIGIAQIPEDGADFSAAYNAADRALYYVKQNGKNAYHFYGEQKADEITRGGTLVDLKYLRELMIRADSGRGAYRLDLEGFQHIYNFLRRFMERSSQKILTVLFTAENGADVEQGALDEALEQLEQAVYRSLRRTDVATRYSIRQIVVLLLNTGAENGEMVVKRIVDCFEKIYDGGQVRFRHDIAIME